MFPIYAEACVVWKEWGLFVLNNRLQRRASRGFKAPPMSVSGRPRHSTHAHLCRCQFAEAGGGTAVFGAKEAVIPEGFVDTHARQAMNSWVYCIELGKI